MKKIILICLVLLTACLPESTKVSDELRCSLLGSEDSLALKINTESGSTLPMNLAIAFKVNDSQLLVDECQGESLLFIEQDRSIAAARFNIEKGSEIHEYYFPNGSESPVVDTAEIQVFKRPDCSSNLELVSNRPNNVITWLPEFANGANCEKTSNTGYSSFKLIP